MKEAIIGLKDGKETVALFKNNDICGFFQDNDVDSVSGAKTGDIYRARVTNVQRQTNSSFAKIPGEITVYVENAMPSQGSNVVVQIKRPAYGEKYALATTKVSLAGRFCVVYKGNSVGISRNIDNETVRAGLTRMANEFIHTKGGNIGVIIRTAAEGAAIEDIKEELEILCENLLSVLEEGAKDGNVEFLHGDENFLTGVLCDEIGDDVELINVQGVELYERVKKYFSKHMPEISEKIRLFNGEYSIFELYNTDAQLRRVNNRKLHLKSGGYIVTDVVEAFTAIDVNSGACTVRDHDAMVDKVNREAAVEIARILQVRNIGGIIIIDFLKFRNETDKERFLNDFVQMLRGDKGKPQVVGFTKLGLVEMTRKRR